ncbi:sugar ABC transporter permease [Curtobacterium sp. MCBD17_040]|uniref:carbohydrate ABC transporter permease n=1 Tax=Curtobacterium sp. MCBD17_040 TaxID=2175674 RepID=UPI000DA9B98C|nr:sugar ABC transporter permease [Curtobacterium sp. MCBD17_040]WIB65262.1 sugar ABC transporter permease [Curtobacterium sp. MCBD17_040]
MDNWATFWFLLPVIAVFLALTAVPLAYTFYYSLTNYNGYSDVYGIVGLQNYLTVFTDPALLQSVGYTLVFTFAVTIAVTCLAIPLAVILNKAFWGRGLARSLFFFLGVPSMAILGLIWRQIFSPLKTGFLNEVVGFFGFAPIPFLSNGHLAQICVIFVAVWAAVGWHATLYIAYLQAIPAELYEQALVDGASPRQQFFNITLPQLVPAITVSTFLLVSTNLKVYDLPYTLTAGGPANATMTLTQSILLRGIGQSQYGVGSALAVLFTIACFVVVLAQLAISSRISRRFS